MSFRKLNIFLLAIFIGAVSPIFGQIVGGTISGAVRDKTGAAVVGATVNVRQIETGASRQLTTDADGRYYAPSVPVGNFVVTVSHEGFQTDQRSGISLAIGQSLQVNFDLGVEKVEQEVIVDAQPDNVNTTTQQTAGLVD